MSSGNGGPAFPSANDVEIGLITTSGHAGMTLRDYFAAKAMQAMITNSFPRRSSESMSELSGIAYRVADAMLAARNEPR